MVLLDLFSGTGGFPLGFSMAGFVFEKHYFSEIDRHAIANYKYNFPDAIYAGAIEKIKAKEIQRPDLITFGFPCQDLSIAGRQEGLSGRRSGLFFQALRLIRELEPSVFIFENVKGLLSSKEGKDFETVLEEIAKLGIYDCQWQVLNTSWFLPQNRERIYFVGCLAEKGRPKIFPFTEGDFRFEKGNEKNTQTNIAPTIDTRVGSGTHWSPYVLTPNDKTQDWVALKRERTEHAKSIRSRNLKKGRDYSSFSDKKLVARKDGIIGTLTTSISKDNLIAKYDQFDVNGKGNRSQSDRIYRTTYSSPTLTSSGSDSLKIYDYKGIRRLTPIECERLQGFPDDWTAMGNFDGEEKMISDTQRYRLVGNAVSVPVVEAIARRFQKSSKKKGVTKSLQGLKEKSDEVYRLLSDGTGSSYKTSEENILSGISEPASHPLVPEINLSYKRESYQNDIPVRSAREAAEIFRSHYPDGNIQLQERFYVMLLSRSLQVLGCCHLATGGITSTVADIRLMLASALKSTATAIMVCHNHPSGSTKPSDADILLTKKLKEACKVMDIDLLDHIILTDTSHFSFAENAVGLSGLNEHNRYVLGSKKEFIGYVVDSLKEGKALTRSQLERKAQQLGINDKTEVKEYSELSVGMVAHQIAGKIDTGMEGSFREILDLYQRQANMSFRTSESILLQQYSTPIPITFLAGYFCDTHKEGEYFEPSAGNGLMAITGRYDNFIVNELDGLRSSNLRTLPFKEVLQEDASKPFTRFQRRFDAILTNPPFGSLEKAVAYQNIEVKNLDHLMALYALDTMKDEGKAAFIIGGHSQWDSKGRLQAGKNLLFFNFLHKHYHVADVINIDGSLYSKQGTSFDVRLVLVSGRKRHPSGNSPLRTDADKTVHTFDELQERVVKAKNKQHSDQMDSTEGRRKILLWIKAKALSLELELLKFDKGEELGSPYMPASASCTVLNTVVPDAMSFEMQGALASIKEAVGGDIDAFVADRLNYANKYSLCHALSAEQTDAVAMAIYNIEAKGQGIIIGDQTGIGKGRIAASIIVYAVNRGMKPIFITEKPNLFSDLYRDLAAIGYKELIPFILNSRESKTDIKDEEGRILHQALPPSEQEEFISSGGLSSSYDFILATYTQFNSPEKRSSKPAFIQKLAQDNILILDESHNSSGSSNTGEFMQKLVGKASGVVFLSATFAKRPDNMPVYAMKTAISEANMSKDNLVSAIGRGGVALQEVLSSQLVAEGQMLRRERSFEGIEVNYISLDHYAERDKRIADGITKIIRRIIVFQRNFITPMVEDMDSELAKAGQLVTKRGGTEAAGVDNMPYFSKVFQVIHQMLFSIKAESVADRAIERLKEGKKPVIAFASTMGSFIETLENEDGLPVGDGDEVRADFSEVLKRGLDGVMRYTITNDEGRKEYEKFDPSDLSQQGMDEYLAIFSLFRQFSSGITISPIDIVIDKIQKAGYTVAEVTGRKFGLNVNTTTGKGIVRSRRKLNTNDAFRMFNNNEVDVLMINQSGSTGASAHAIVTSKVPKEEVRQRVMIILQAELDINTEVQKRGRINRTGQILLPIYDYVVSAIPAEKRLMMMLQKKLKSLDANTTSNQKQSNKILDVPDFLNKYGDKVVMDYLSENDDVNILLGDPLNIIRKVGPNSHEHVEDAAHKVSGRVAVLSVEMQEKFYQDISIRYNDFTDYLRQTGSFDLEVETMDLKARQLSSRIVKAGKGGQSSFGEDTFLERLEVDVLKKPFTADELEKLIRERLDGKSLEEYKRQLMADLSAYTKRRKDKALENVRNNFLQLKESLPEDKKLLTIKESQGNAAYQDALIDKARELEERRKNQLEDIEKKFHYDQEFMQGYITFFYPGRQLEYPIVNLSQEAESPIQYVPAISLGILTNKGENNWLPSQVKVSIAIASSLKYITLPVSYQEILQEVIRPSKSIMQEPMAEMKAKWNRLVARRTSTREERFMVTGNLLQAYSDFNSGRLVSYTTENGEVRKGILLPESFSEKENENVSVPILRAKPIIASMNQGTQLKFSGEISLFRVGDGYKMVVPASRNRGGDYYLDEEIKALTQKGKFESYSGKMIALVPFHNLGELLHILQEKFNSSVTISLMQYEMLGDRNLEVSKHRVWKTLQLKNEPVPYDNKERKRKLLSLKAKALALELEFLNYSA